MLSNSGFLHSYSPMSPVCRTAMPPRSLCIILQPLSTLLCSSAHMELLVLFHITVQPSSEPIPRPAPHHPHPRLSRVASNRQQARVPLQGETPVLFSKLLPFHLIPGMKTFPDTTTINATASHQQPQHPWASLSWLSPPPTWLGSPALHQAWHSRSPGH